MRLPPLLARPPRYGVGMALLYDPDGEALGAVFAQDGAEAAAQRAAALAEAANFLGGHGEDLEDVLRVLLETRRLPLKLRRRLEGIEAGLRTALLAVVPEETRGDARAGRVRL